MKKSSSISTPVQDPQAKEDQSIELEQAYSHKRGMHNKLSNDKIKYIYTMRKDLCDCNIVHQNSGELNFKYFNVKKGQYWSNFEQVNLIQCIIKYGATAHQEILGHRQKKSSVKKFMDLEKEDVNEEKAREPFKGRSVTEIRLRVMKVLRVYDLSVYAQVQFSSQKDIFDEAERNREKGIAAGQYKHGVWYNRPVDKVKDIADAQSFMHSFFNKNTQKTTPTAPTLPTVPSGSKQDNNNATAMAIEQD